jgi:hypothetical protein
VKEDKKLYKSLGLPILYPLIFLEKIDELLVEALPDKYKAALEHYLTAKSELLKALTELINIKIRELEELKGNLQEVKREKVEIE